MGPVREAEKTSFYFEGSILFLTLLPGTEVVPGVVVEPRLRCACWRVASFAMFLLLWRWGCPPTSGVPMR